jgi:hypothetical protein
MAKSHDERHDEELSEDFTSTVKGKEREALVAIAARLEAGRPLPRPGLRSAIRSGLVQRGRPRAARRAAPRSVGALIAGYAGAGALLLAIAALGVAGMGPFAA